LIDSYSYQLTNTLENGSRVKEIVSIGTLDDVFIGQRLNTYIAPPVLQTRSGKVFNKQGLIDDFGKEGDANTLEFYMFENNVSGRMTAVRKIDVEDYANKEDPFSGGKFEFSYKTEMNMKEAEKYMLQKSEDKINRALKAVSGDTKFGGPGYVEPGGKDYKELIFKLKGDKSYPVEQELLAGAIDGSYKKTIKSAFPYTSPNVHFGTKNEFAHVRFKTRDLNGQKVLAVEEMQSDIVQDMKRNFGERVTDFPFKNNWYELVTKRLIRYAADNNLDAVAIPKGSTIASRYKQKIDFVKEINLEPRIGPSGNDLRFVVTYFGGGNREIRRQTLYNDEILELQKELGSKNYLKVKDQIDDAINNIKSKKDIKKDLIIGKFDNPIEIGDGKGKASLYDKAIPSFLKKYGKKWNAKVYDEELDLGLAYGSEGTGKIPVTIIQLTDDMKKSVQHRYKQKIDNVKEINLEPRIGPSGNDLRFVVTYFGGGNREIRRQTLYNDEILELQKELGSKNYLKVKDQIDEAIKNIKSKKDIKKDLIIGKFDNPIQIGTGKGKGDLYDKAIPSFLKKYGKKWNAKVYEEELDLGLAYGSEGTGKIPVTIIQLTDDMKKSVQQDGQALFEIFGIGSATAVGANAVSDSIKNNTISQKTN